MNEGARSPQEDRATLKRTKSRPRRTIKAQGGQRRPEAGRSEGTLIQTVQIRNFKSISELDLELGRFNVFIGENGSGKSNALEAIAFAAASHSGKLDNELLSNRGVRVTDPRFMRSAFLSDPHISIKVRTPERHVRLIVREEPSTRYPKWHVAIEMDSVDFKRFMAELDKRIRAPSKKRNRGPTIPTKTVEDFLRSLVQVAGPSAKAIDPKDPAALSVGREALVTLIQFMRRRESLPFEAFLIYSPETRTLRTFEREGQVLPLGVRGEGLFKLLTVLASGKSTKERKAWADLKNSLRLLDWFDDIEVPNESTIGPDVVRIKDRFVPATLGYFDQRSANEAFLYLLFYLSLFVSSDTPQSFGIDNIDASLNPKTCRVLIQQLSILAKKHQKQVIVTTHNPAVLDGLDLRDEDQRLFVFRRGKDGDTKARRVSAIAPLAGEAPIKLSEAFLRGLLGGLPQNF